MMQIMEFADRRVACFLHFHKGHCSNGLNILRTELIKEPIHQLPPRPETFAVFGAIFAHACHGALKAVAMQIWQRRQKRIDAQIACNRC